jgi:hypothetical protein
MDTVKVRLYDPFQEGGHRYLGSLDAEISFAGRKATETPFDQDDLAQHFTKVPLLGIRLSFLLTASELRKPDLCA